MAAMKRMFFLAAVALSAPAFSAGMLIDRANAPWNAFDDAHLRRAAAVARTRRQITPIPNDIGREALAIYRRFSRACASRAW